MIDWMGLLQNALWIVGLAVVVAGFSYADWRRSLRSPRPSLKTALGSAGFQAVAGLGMLLFCAGLALGSNRPWEMAAWALLGLLFAGLAVRSWRAARGRP